MKKLKNVFGLMLFMLFACLPLLQASEVNLAIPDLHEGTFHILGKAISSWDFLFYGALIITGTLGISLYLFQQIKKLPAHHA